MSGQAADDRPPSDRRAIGGESREVPGPLEGLMVLDLTQMLSGPYCTMVLCDLGARVVKVEPPGGDTTRRMVRIPENDDPKSFGGYFQSVNRNKESIVLDLKTEAACEVVRRLVPRADVLVENYRNGVMERLGLSYESLQPLNPRLVYAALRGFGDSRTGASPYLDWPAFDVVAQAMGGFMGITGLKGGEPLKGGPGIGDTIPALFLAIGILSAVIRARDTGQGQFVDVGMYDGILAICERIVFQHEYLGQVPGPEGTGHPVLCPFGIFPAKDGHVAIACPHEHFWAILTAEMGRPELAEDPRFRSNEDRAANREMVEALVGGWSGALSKTELAESLGGRVPFGPVNRADDIVGDPHVAARSLLATVMQPGEGGGPVHIVNTPIHHAATPGGVRRRAALLGEDTDAVLGDFGFTAEEIGRLRAAGAVA